MIIAGRLLIWCLVWLTLRAPLPLCHEHAAQAVRPGEARLERHLHAHHAGPQAKPRHEWHVHWVSCWELRKCGFLDEDNESSVPPESGGSTDDLWMTSGSISMESLGSAELSAQFVVIPQRLGQSGMLSGNTGRPAGGLLAVHRKDGGVRALTGVALC